MRRAALAAVLLLATACGGPSDTQTVANPFGDSPPTSDVEVDTPQLRALKRQAGITACPPTEGREAVAGGLPDLTLPCLGGGRDVHLPGLAGRPIVVNLWASWCEPCREELPRLQEYAERADGRVGVIGVDFMDVRPDAALELARRSGVTYPLVADLGAQLRGPLRLPGMPVTVIVDAEGRIARTMPGEIDSVDQLDDAVSDAVGIRLDD
jgi:cytochrome c biogenesis protein CcmG, thiol:disulfide interchange protein DsbE